MLPCDTGYLNHWPHAPHQAGHVGNITIVARRRLKSIDHKYTALNSTPSQVANCEVSFVSGQGVFQEFTTGTSFDGCCYALLTSSGSFEHCVVHLKH